MTNAEPYPTPRGVENAIKDAATKAAASDPSLDVNKRIQLEYFNRLLSRVFSEDDGSEWVLKGGTSILARVPSTRSTRDVDLSYRGCSLAEALDELIRLAAIDLEDHFRFEYAGHTNTMGNDAQPYTDGQRVRFNIFIGLRAKGSLQIDLVVGAGITGEVTRIEPAIALDLPRLVSHQYRLYPVVDQIADKVCATMIEHGERASTREKDLVDLVVFATTHDIDGTALSSAISAEARRRRMDPIRAFAAPSWWGAGYSKLSKSVPYCADYRTVERALSLLTRLIDPALSEGAHGMTWMHRNREWI